MSLKAGHRQSDLWKAWDVPVCFGFANESWCVLGYPSFLHYFYALFMSQKKRDYHRLFLCINWLNAYTPIQSRYENSASKHGTIKINKNALEEELNKYLDRWYEWHPLRNSLSFRVTLIGHWTWNINFDLRTVWRQHSVTTRREQMKENMHFR
jgi:hypothetical protein